MGKEEIWETRGKKTEAEERVGKRLKRPLKKSENRKRKRSKKSKRG
jgi:hypothetical protein